VTAKILLLDIENAPMVAFSWGPMWETRLIEIIQPWYMLSFAYKWHGQKKVTVKALPDYPLYATDPKNDKALASELRDLLDEADIVVAHNGDRFDLPKCASRILVHGIKPPSPYKTVDTLKLARKLFRYESNKLDDLCRILGIGVKLKHTGFDLWKRCMEGDSKAWALMKKYNAHDVSPLLEGLYDRIKPFAPNHPKLTHYTRASACPTCQSSNIQSRGFNVTATGKRQRIHCQDCGAWSTTGPLIKEAA
jgi:DNA polymerase elongation subunit (family B)